MAQKKDRRATDALNVALSGAESALSVASTMAGADAGHAIAKASKYLEEAREHLLTIQFHANQI
jgi:hypothetical protein